MSRETIVYAKLILLEMEYLAQLHRTWLRSYAPLLNEVMGFDRVIYRYSTAHGKKYYMEFYGYDE